MQKDDRPGKTERRKEQSMQQVDGWAKQLFGRAMLQQERLFEHLEIGVVGKELWMMYLMQRLSARFQPPGVSV
jgi:hypothetical protein